MSQSRKGTGAATAGPVPLDDLGTRPLSARSVVASALLGMPDPVLPARVLVACGQLFGIAEGTTRTALSRMVGAGELVAAGEGAYRLAGPLLARRARQAESRRPPVRAWRGDWVQAVVVGERRAAADRSELRTALRTLHLAEVREGLWVRPDNLDPDRHPAAWAVVDRQCRRWRSRPVDDDPAALAAALWDLAGWSDRAGELLAALDRTRPALEAGDAAAIRPGFVTAAAVLRHLLADPLLPPALTPDGWPGDALRAAYDDFDRTFGRTWQGWLAGQR